MPNYIQQLRKNNPEFSGLNSIDLLGQAYKAGAGKEGESFEEFLSRPGIQEAYGDEELRLNSPNLSTAGDFARGVKRGVVKNTAGTFAEIANFAARNTGWEGAENLSQDALDTLEEFYNSPELKQSYAAATGDWKNLNHLMSATGEGGTSIAAIFASGGVGAIAKGGLKVAAKTMAKRAAKTGLKRATNLHKLTSMAAKFAPGYAASAQIAGSALMGAEQAGDIRQYEARTGEDVGTLTELSTVLPNAIIGGYLESFMPSVFVNKPLAALAKRKIGSELSKELTETGFKAWLKATGKGVGVGAAGEFVTEYAQTVLGNSLAKAGYDVDRNVLGGAFESGLVGALTGGGLGGVSSGASKAIELTAKPKDVLSAKIKEATNTLGPKPPASPPKFQGPLDTNSTDSNIPTQPTPGQELEMDTIQRASQQPDMQMSEEDQLLASITGEEAFAELSAREETIQKAEQERRPREFVTEEGILKGVEKSTDEILFAPEEPVQKTREDVFKENKNWSDVTPEDKSLFVTQADYNKNRLRFNRGDTFEKEKIQTNRKTKIKTPEKKAVATGKPKPKPKVKVKKASGVVAKLKTVNDLLTRFKSIEEIGNLNTPSIKKRFYKVLSDAGITNRSEFKTAKTNLGKSPELTKLNKEELRFGSEEQIKSFISKDRILVDKDFKSVKQAENYVGNTKGLSGPEVFKQENSDGTFTYKVSSAKPQPTESSVTDVGVRGPVSIKKAYKRFMGKTFSFKREDVTDSKKIVDISPVVNKIVADLQRTIRVSYGDDVTEDKKGQLGISDLTGKVSEGDTMEAWSRQELNRDISAREQSDYEVALRKLRNLEEEIEIALMNPAMSSKEIMQVLRGFTKKTASNEKEIESQVKEQEAIIVEAEKTLLDFTVESDQRVTEAVAMRLQALGKLEDIKADRAEASGELSYLLYGESGKQIKKYLDARVSGETKMTLSQIRGLQSLTSSQGRDIALGKKKSLSGLSELYAMRTPEYWLGDPDFIAYQRAKYAGLEFSSLDHKFKSFEDFVSFAVEDQIAEAKSKIRLNFKLHKPTKIQYPPNTPKELLFLDESISEDLTLLAKLASQEKLSVWDNPKWDAAFKRYNKTTKKRSELLLKLLKAGKISTKEFAAYTFSLDHNLQQAGKIAAGHKSPGTIPMSSSELLEKSIRDIESFERETVTDTSRFTEDTKGATPKIDGDVGEGSDSTIKTEPVPPLQLRVEEQIGTGGNETLILAATADLKKSQGIGLTQAERSAAKFVKDSKIPGIKNVVLSLAAKISHGYVAEEARNIRDSKEVTVSTIFFGKLNTKVAEGSNAREFLGSLGEVSDSHPATKATLKLLKNLLQHANTSDLDSLRVVQSQGTRAHFKNGTIYLPKGLTNLYTVAHELIHGLVAQKINNNATGTNELKRLYELAKLAALGSENPVAGALYALNQQDDLTGLQEFAAELLLNPSLQDLLKTTKDPDQPKKSLWDRFISTLKNILGIEADNSLLSSSVDALANLIKVEKPQDTNPVPTLYSEGRGKTKPEPVSDSEIISEYMQDVFGFSEAEIEAIMEDPFLSEKANAMVISKIGQDTLEETAGKRLSKDEQKILDGAVDQKTENERKKSDRNTYNKEHYRKPIREALEQEGDFTKKKLYSQLAMSVHSWTLTMHNMIDVMTNFKESASKEFKELFIRRVSDSESAKLKFIQAREKNLDNIFKKYALDREKMETERTVVRDGFTNRSTGEWVPEKSMKLWNALMIYATRSNPDFQKQLAETQEGRSLKNIRKEAEYLVKNLSEGHKFLADVMQKDLANQSKMVSKKISELESVYVLKNGIEISPKLREKLDNTLEGYGYFKDSDNYMPVLGRKVFANEDMLGDVAQVLQIAPEGRKRIKKEVDTSQGVNQNLFYVWSQTTRNQSHFLNYADVINDMWDVMRGGADQGRLDNLIYKKFGSQTLESMEAYIHSVAKPTAHIAKDGVSRLATKIRGAAALSFLGWNVMTMAKQVPSFAYFFAKVNPSFMLRTVQQALEPGGFKKILEFVKKDAQMFDRQIEQVLDELDSMDSGMFEKLLGKALSKTPGLPPEVALKVKKKTFKSLMLGIRAADQVVTSIGYYAAYQQATKEGLNEADARFKALQVVVSSQPASNVKDVGRLWRHNSITSTFLMFTNQLAKIYNMGMHDVLLKGLALKTFDKEMAATSIALSVGALGIGIISHGFRWEDDDEETGFVREGVDMLGAGAVSTIPFFGGSMAAAWAGYPSPTDLGKSLGYNAVKTGLNLVQGEFAKATKSAMRTTLFPGQAELLRVWQAFDTSSPEYGITRLAGAKRVFDSEDSLIPIIEQYKKALEYERRNAKEISEVKKEVRRLKRKAANAGRAGRAGEAARARREATQLKSSIESGKWKHKIEALTKKWSLDKQKVQQLMRSM